MDDGRRTTDDEINRKDAKEHRGRKDYYGCTAETQRFFRGFGLRNTDYAILSRIIV
jgi:hypothetical protein